MYNAYYAITSQSQYGVENNDITNTLVYALNTELKTGPLILELTDAEAAKLLMDFSTGNVSGTAFHSDWLPFKLPRRRSNLKIADTQRPPDDDDLSGTFWLGYTRLNELLIYAEVKDEEVVLSSTGVADPWNYDTIEIGWANYDVRDDGGDVIFGTPHHDMQRGAHADYQFRIGGRDGGASAFAEVVTPSVGEVGGAVYSPWMDENGAQVRYKILAFMPLDAIQLALPFTQVTWQTYAFGSLLRVSEACPVVAERHGVCPCGTGVLAVDSRLGRAGTLRSAQRGLRLLCGRRPCLPWTYSPGRV